MEQALKFMLGSCQIANSALETKRTPEGRLEVTIALPNGQRRAVSLVKSDMDTFMAGAVQVKAQASLPVIQCMDPHIDEVIATLPLLPDRPTAVAPPPPPAYVPPALPPVTTPAPPPMVGAAPPAMASAACSDRAACYDGGSFTAQVIRALITSCRVNASYGVLLTTVRVTNRSSEPIALAYTGGSIRAVDNLGRRWAPPGSCEDESRGIGRTGYHGAYEFLLAPGESREVAFGAYVQAPVEQARGSRLDLELGLDEAAGTPLARRRSHAARFAGVAETSGPAPMAQALPAGGDLPVGVVNGTVAPAPQATPSATVAGGRLAATLTQCKGWPDGHVQCDVRVTNRTGQDVKLIVQGANTRALGEEGTNVLLYQLRMGESNHYPSGNEKEIRLDFIADASPVMQFHFYNVPNALLSIKRLEVTMGARVGTDADMQKFLFANVPIQGR